MNATGRSSPDTGNRPRRPARLVGLAALAATLILRALPLQAAEAVSGETARKGPSEKGIYLGVELIGASLGVDENDGGIFTIDDQGGGLLVRLGYRFNPIFSLQLSLAGSSHDTSDPAITGRVSTLLLHAVYRFAPGHTVRPYIEGGFGAYALRLEGAALEPSFSGGGVSFGGGLDVFLGRHVALGADLILNLLEYDDVELVIDEIAVSTAIDEDAFVGTLGLSLSYYF